MPPRGWANAAYPLPQQRVQRYALPSHRIQHLILERFNDAAKRGVYSLQEFFTLAGKALGFIFVKPFYTADLFQQMDVIGVGSLGIVLLTGFFTGMVLALQSSVTLQALGQTALIGKLIAGSMVRELGPVLAGLMVAGRVGSGIAAQLGSMRVTEQIDALNTLGTDPIKKLVTPRVLASLVMLPALTIINDFVGILGGNIIARFFLGLPTSLYWRTVFEQLLSGGFTLHYIPNDFMQGLIKPFVFGGIISLVACYHGLKTSGGTEGVGLATTRTVVTASILILVVDYFLTQALLAIFTP
jgi:phospholipid/cholesterol/gamma-HCH transport system permease protein